MFSGPGASLWGQLVGDARSPWGQSCPHVGVTLQQSPLRSSAGGSDLRRKQFGSAALAESSLGFSWQPKWQVHAPIPAFPPSESRLSRRAVALQEVDVRTEFCGPGEEVSSDPLLCARTFPYL